MLKFSIVHCQRVGHSFFMGFLGLWCSSVLQLQFCDANFVCQTFYWHISCSAVAAAACLCCRFVGCWLCRVLSQQTRLKLKCALFCVQCALTKSFQNSICILCEYVRVCVFKAAWALYATTCCQRASQSARQLGSCWPDCSSQQKTSLHASKVRATDRYGRLSLVGSRACAQFVRTLVAYCAAWIILLSII